MNTSLSNSWSDRTAAGPGVRSLARVRLIGRIVFQPTLRFTAYLLVMQVLLFELLRLCMYLRNRDMADAADPRTIATAFLVGSWFDLATAGYATIPLFLLARLTRSLCGPSRELQVYTVLASISGAAMVVLGLVELEFYREFLSRFNTIALQYFGHTGTVLTMVWCGFPVLRYLLLALIITAGYVFALRKLARLAAHDIAITRTSRATNLLTLLIGLTILIVAARGGLRRIPLQWADASFSQSTFANHLAENGLWALGRAVSNYCHDNRAAKALSSGMSEAESYRRMRQLLSLPHEEWVGDEQRYPLFRRSNPAERSVTLRAPQDQPPNVVFILMESFSGRYIGALGADTDLSPEFNRLTENGILFERCFSQGQHTHQAMYASHCSFPNLPGFEYVMQTAMGNQRFDGMPAAFKRRGYQTMFLCASDPTFDCMQGFLHTQGVDNFIGRDDFDAPAFQDATWGVSDRELFQRANQEFARAQKPFYATILTISNHQPFALPRPLPFPEITDAGKLNDRVNAFRFADWAVGYFFQLARNEQYFKNTLFVLCGDHGASVQPVLTDINFLRHHVPLLFYAPELLGDQPRRIRAVSSQVDIAPTILGLVGDTEPHQYFGRDMFMLPQDDRGFAIFKPSDTGSGIGYVRDNLLLVKSSDGKEHLFYYDLGFPPAVQPVESPDRDQLREMEKDLRAYLKTGMELLTRHRIAP